MSDHNQNKVYTAGDIQQYLEGKLSPAQMHEMERAALDDPFLAEAMEGYEGMKEKNWNSTLAAIRRQVSESGTEAKVVPMHRTGSRWWKTAAAVLLIGAGAALTYTLTKNNSTDKPGGQIAEKITTTPVTGNAKDTTAETSGQKAIVSTPEIKNEKTTVTVPDQQVTIPTKPEQAIAIVPSSREKSDDIARADRGLSDPGRVKQPSVSPTLNPVPPTANNNATVANESSKLEKVQDNAFVNRQNASGNAEKKDLPLNKSFIAQVVGADNSPLPFSNISVKTDNFGTYADVKGNFRLVSSDSIITVEVKSVGYIPRTITLRSDLAQNKIVMLEDEATVKNRNARKDIGSLTRTPRASISMDSIVNAEPKDGWANYNTYIANNIDIPDDVLQKGLHGEVGISFDINPDGAITNIRVDKSLGSNYDEAAKRLIEQGPQWKVKKGKKTSARVKVQF